MEGWMDILLPLLLLLGRVTAFLVVLPIFGWQSLPVTVRAGVAVMLTVFLGRLLPVPAAMGQMHWLGGLLLMVRELLCGLGLGLAVRLVYAAVQQGALMALQQMGLADAGVIDPDSGEDTQPAALLFEWTFTLLFLVAGGHRLLVLVLARSFDAFPLGSPPEAAVLAEEVLFAGSHMLLLALRLAAPVVAAFLVLAVVLGVLARVLPEMNILMSSFPLRVAAGMLMARAILPVLDAFTSEVADWIQLRLMA